MLSPKLKRLCRRSLGFVVVLFCLLLIDTVAHADEESRKGIVVWRLEAKTGVSEKDIDSISGFVTAEVEKSFGGKAVSDSDLKTILQGEEKKQQCGAEGTSCIAEIGAALGVPEAVSGDLGRMGDYWLLNLRRINVYNATVIGRSSKQIKGNVNALIESIPLAVAALFEKEPDLAPEAVPKPEPEPETKQEPVQQAQKTDKASMNTLNKTAFGTFFSGVGLVALGGIAHWQMDQANSDGATGDSGAESRHSTWKGMAATGYAVGGALMVTGIVLWIVDAKSQKKSGDETTLHFGASPSDDGVFACLWGRW